MADSAAQVKEILDKYQDIFATMHFMIEEHQALFPLHYAQKDLLMQKCQERTKATVLDAIDKMRGDEAPDGRRFNEVVLRLSHALAEDFLLRVDPVLNPDPFEVDVDPAPDQSL